ncbi:MAG: ubiquinol-cytochrome c reductase iron-sulfur subunit [Pseudomonadales bacterium]|jgi:ubiquinol-cytochrome c reductase iron-sulfur subunit|nr:ubiquinol-cytochrome c reductase iron-sulfur subunit [Pseudomonadales bacterium]MCP5332014.1 ubiquinol-cytochrome c reductase iron-sulfur subunit [Pseudomonadales bacterium]HMU89983.1 ubiquinol-cytochrome c reductase iron-sulfur subunit [Pseudomonadales bacterium]HMW15286.1 ubiquinol-cytochrome c reductase iron-sulfur subunit [Pseudomonadales bacterium]HMW83174.1 ubiquinol-cytochrome c reductase iron-sulfur subunit [Pseudomonadales bacterium]
MSSEGEVNAGRRRFLIGATSVVGAVGVVGAAVPFVGSWNPSAKAKAAGAPVKADLSKLEPGQMVVVEWRGKPVFVVRRTKEALDQLTKMDAVLADPAGAVTSQQPESIKSPYRSIEPEYLVVLGVCTHLGCSPKFRPELAPADLGADWKGGFFCPCHGSRFDLSGRVYKGVPAPTNLEVPPYSFVGDKVILIGSEEGAA